jgi:hypothetical protein
LNGEFTVDPLLGTQIETPAAEGSAQFPGGGGGGGGAPPTVNDTVAVCSVPVLSHAFTVSLCVPAASVADPDIEPELDAATCVLST